LKGKGGGVLNKKKKLVKKKVQKKCAKGGQRDKKVKSSDDHKRFPYALQTPIRKVGKIIFLKNQGRGEERICLAAQPRKPQKKDRADEYVPHRGMLSLQEMGQCAKKSSQGFGGRESVHSSRHS